MRNTIRKVMMVVPVLTTSCHCSENPNIGPQMAHPTMNDKARMNAGVLPVASVTIAENRSDQFELCGLLTDVFIGIVFMLFVKRLYPE